MRRSVAAKGFSRRHLRDKWWSSKVVELAFLGQPALPILAGLLLPQGCRPGCSVSRPAVGSQVPSTLASSHRKPARHSGGRLSGAKRTINSLRAGLPKRRVTQEVAAPGAQAGEGWGLWPPSFPEYSLQRQRIREQPPPPWVLSLSLGWARGEACARELKVSVFGKHCGWEGWRAEGKTGLTVTYADVTGH